MHEPVAQHATPASPDQVVKGGTFWDVHDEPFQCFAGDAPSPVTASQSTGAVHAMPVMPTCWLFGGDTSVHTEPSPRNARPKPPARQCHESKHETATRSN